MTRVVMCLCGARFAGRDVDEAWRQLEEHSNVEHGAVFRRGQRVAGQARAASTTTTLGGKG